MADLHFLANPARFRRFSQRVLPGLSLATVLALRGRPLARAGPVAARLPAGRDGAHHVRARALGLAVDGGLCAAGRAGRRAPGVAPSAGRADGARRRAGRRRASRWSACSPARCGAGRCGAPTGCGTRGSPRCCCCSSSISATSRSSRAYDDPERGDRAAAILALVGVINLPIIKFSVDWWNTLHQPASVDAARRPADPSRDPGAAAADGGWRCCCCSSCWCCCAPRPRSTAAGSRSRTRAHERTRVFICRPTRGARHPGRAAPSPRSRRAQVRRELAARGLRASARR